MRKPVLLAAALAGVMIFSPTPGHARTNTRTKPIVFVHGLDAFFASGSDCNSWNSMVSRLQGWGWTGSMMKLKYYAHDVNCTHTLDHHGSHSTHYGGTSEHDVDVPSSHGFDSRIEHIAYHLAWFIRDHYTASNVTVDLVGHSMGGLIIRYALAQVARHHADFPSSLLVEDVVTLGTPHTGTSWANGCWWADQCGQMVPGSSFINWLSSYAQNPQMTGGTDWTTQGSYEDNYVSQTSATGMDATHRVRYYASAGVEHGDYLIDTSDARTADVEYWDRPGPWYAWYDAPYSVRWTDFALYNSTW